MKSSPFGALATPCPDSPPHKARQRQVATDGAVKVLDFGLAKALEPMSPGGIDATASPTIISPAIMTGAGVLLINTLSEDTGRVPITLAVNWPATLE